MGLPLGVSQITASPIRRLGAVFFDGLMLYGVFAIGLKSRTPGHAAAAWGEAVVVLAYYIVGVGLFGRTLGKWILGIQVLSLEGLPPGLWHAFVRLLVEVLGCLPLVGWFVYWGVVFHADGRGLHDKAAGTIVVSAR